MQNVTNEINVMDVINALSVKSVRNAKNNTYVISAKFDMTVKFAPQARLVMIAILKKCMNDNVWELSDNDIADILSNVDMKTKQDKMHIFKYYRKTLVDAGMLTVK